MSITSEWNLKQKRLKETIRKFEKFDEAKKLFLSMHGSVHFAKVSNLNELTIIDRLMTGLQKRDYAIMPTDKDVTIAWNIWHITRIEDLTINILVDQSEQVLNSDWLKRLNIDITDTGNAMTDDEIMNFSKSINIEELLRYRVAVGIQTQKILSCLKFEDTKHKIEKKDTEKILNEGGVLSHPDSIWLLDYWGKKDIAGIILMPITRHQIMHLNDCFKLKQSIDRKKTFYRI
ncbi:MAG: DinB family protein [Anaeromicrobium sp.]|uniref:DinB family protein n=1 Tax=Anaeromicrobium sp. TaxID=1929132 RepID=UPI0025DDE936|nr:DinB family protein [Anaeromicrobium sp.]MCT4593050.1 DinB family protein [Anaeromicrobium sp.]